ncbi:phage holin family protein [Patescibacteria group bacterium]
MFFLQLVFRLIINIFALWLTAQFVNGVDYHNNWRVLVVAGVVLGLLNMFIKPILKLISAPCLWLLLGILFPLVINLLLLYLTAWLVPGFEIQSFWSAILGTIIISILNFILSLIFIRRK